MSGEVTLAVGATAETNTCGSCKYFSRTMDMGEYNMSTGVCKFELPEKLRYLFAPKVYVEGDEDRVRLRDTSRCDLWKDDGKVYIVQRRTK